VTDIITLEQAKSYVRAPLDVHQDDDAYYLMLEIAHQLVLDHCRQYCSSDATEVATAYALVNAWTVDTAPAGVKAAILETFRDLDSDRGDAEVNHEARRPYSLSPRAAGYLVRLRDPVLR
jgi:hypothetical protein